MRLFFVITFVYFLNPNANFAQHLDEHDWAKLSNLAETDNTTAFASYLTKRNFAKVEEPNEKYTFYQWNQESPYFYGIRINKKSKQVTYITNDNGYVLNLLSRFLTAYTLIQSDKKDSSTTHIFRSPDYSTIAIKLDTTKDSGSHLLFAISKS